MGHKHGKSPQHAGRTVSGKSKRNMSLQCTCLVGTSEPAENGVLLKEYRCVYAFQVNYGKPSDCNKIIRRYFNESFYF